MEIQFSYKAMDTSPALNEYTESKLAHFQNLLLPNAAIKVRYEAEHQAFQFHVSCTAIDRKPIEISVETDEMRKSIDRAMDKLGRLLRDAKEKRADKRPQVTTREMDAQAAEADLEATPS